MKRFFVFTLTALFAITCLLVGNLRANMVSCGDYGYAGIPFNDVYGYVYVTLWYNAETSTAYSSHYFFLDNGDDVPIEYVYYFYSDVSGPADIPSQGVGGDGVVALNDEDSDTKLLSYNMEGEEGEFTINGGSDLVIFADTDHDGTRDSWWWSTPPCSTDFEL